MDDRDRRCCRSFDSWPCVQEERRRCSRVAEDEHSHEQIEVAPSAPQGSHAGHAVGFASQVSAQAADPQRGLSDRGRRGLSRGAPAMDVGPQRAPLLAGQHDRARGLGRQTRVGVRLGKTQYRFRTLGHGTRARRLPRGCGRIMHTTARGISRRSRIRSAASLTTTMTPSTGSSCASGRTTAPGRILTRLSGKLPRSRTPTTGGRGQTCGGRGLGGGVRLGKTRARGQTWKNAK